MIQVYTYRAPVDGLDVEVIRQAILADVQRLIRVRQSVRGVQVEAEDGILYLRLRMSGLDRWRIAGEARKVGSLLLASHKLPYLRPLVPHAVSTEASRRHLTLEEGRVPKSDKGRGARTSTPEPIPQAWS